MEYSLDVRDDTGTSVEQALDQIPPALHILFVGYRHNNSRRRAECVKWQKVYIVPLPGLLTVR